MQDHLSVNLPSNPSTGFTWTATLTPQGVLAQTGPASYQPGSAGRIGQSGTAIFGFTASRPGAATVKLVYARSFEPSTPPASTFTVSVRVLAPVS